MSRVRKLHNTTNKGTITVLQWRGIFSKRLDNSTIKYVSNRFQATVPTAKQLFFSFCLLYFLNFTTLKKSGTELTASVLKKKRSETLNR